MGLFSDSMDEEFNVERKEARKLADALHGDVLLWYDNLYASIVVKLIKVRTSNGYYSKQSRWVAYKRICKLIDAMILKLNRDSRFALKKIAKLITMGTIKGLDKQRSFRSISKQVEDVLARHSDDLKTHSRLQCERIKAQIWRMMRDEAISILNRSRIDGITKAEAQKELITQSIDGDFSYIDNRGYRWDSKTYFDVLIRTIIIESERDVAGLALLESGEDLARITVVPTNDECNKWMGKVISLTGKTKGYPTLEQVKSTGEIFHPRCRHSIVPYRSADELQ